MLSRLLRPAPGRLRLGPWFLSGPLAGLIVLSLIGIPFAVDRWYAGYQLIRRFLLLGLYLQLLNAPITPGLVAWPLAAGMVIQAAVGLPQFVLGHSLGLKRLGEVTVNAAWPGASVVMVGEQRWLRAYGLVQHPNFMGGCLMVMLLLVSGYYLTRSGWRRLPLLVALVAGLVTLLLTFSRAAWLGTLLGGLLMMGLLLWARHQGQWSFERSSPALLATASALVILLFVTANWSLLQPRLGLTVQGVEIRSVDARMMLIQAAAALIQMRPLLGVGLGNFPIALHQLAKETVAAYPVYEPVHNVLLLTSAELGLLGGLLWACLILAPCLALWFRRRHVRRGAWWAGLSGALATTAREAGYSVSIFDGMFESDDAAFTTALERERTRVVGIGILATVRSTALRLAELAHRHGAAVVVGGADPTGRPESYLTHQSDGHRPIDLVVVGEGEQTLLEVLPLLLAGNGDKAPPARVPEVANVPGLTFRKAAGQVVSTPPREHCTELDSLPLPARDLIDIEAYRRAWQGRHGLFSLSIIATRGCPYGCKWCQKSVLGRSFRPRSPALVAEEMRVIKEQYHPDQLRIVDDVMGIDRKWVRARHSAVLAKDAVTPSECLSRVDLMDEELARLLKEAGCVRIAFGAESGSQQVLDAMNKGTRVEQIRQAADLCRRYDIETYFYIMLGYPGEEWADIRLTRDLLKETRPKMFSSTIAYPLPGTDFYEEVKHRLLDTPDWDYAAENRLLFEREYSTRFYRWVQRWLYLEWRATRLRHGQDSTPPLRRVRLQAGLSTTRAVVELLRHFPSEQGAG